METVQYRAMCVHCFCTVSPLRCLLDIFSLSFSHENLIPEIYYISPPVLWPFGESQTLKIAKIFFFFSLCQEPVFHPLVSDNTLVGSEGVELKYCLGSQICLDLSSSSAHSLLGDLGQVA